MTKRVVLSGNSPGLASVDATLTDLANDASGDSTKALYGDGTFKVPGGGGASVQTVTITFTASQILNSVATPITVVAAPGAGKSILALGSSWTYTYGAQTYTTGGTTGLWYGSASGPGVESNALNSLLAETSSQIMQNYGAGGGGSIAAKASFENQPIVFATQTTAPTVGDGTLKLTLVYIIITD
jgi:hypothetical protein